MAERQREKEVARGAAGAAGRRVARACGDAIEAAVATFNGTPGDAASFDALHELLEAQPYRLVVLAHRIARDQLPAVLRRQHAGRPARRTPGGLRRDAPAARRADSRRQGPGRPHRSSRRPVRSRAVFRDAAGAGRARPGASTRRDDVGGRPIGRCTSSPKRSCPAASGCRAAGRCTARPATTSSTISTACSSTPRRRAGCAASTRS